MLLPFTILHSQQCIVSTVFFWGVGAHKEGLTSVTVKASACLCHGGPPSSSGGQTALHPPGGPHGGQLQTEWPQVTSQSLNVNISLNNISLCMCDSVSAAEMFRQGFIYYLYYQLLWLNLVSVKYS